MRCLAAGYEERRRRRWRCCGGVQIPVEVYVDVDCVHDGGCRCGGLRPVAGSVQVPEPAKNEAARVSATRAQRQRVLNHRQRTTRGSGPAQRLQVHGASTQLQRGHRVQRRRGHRCRSTDDSGKVYAFSPHYILRA